MTAVTHMDHDQDYPADYLATILKDVKTIAMVGASSDPDQIQLWRAQGSARDRL